MEFVFYIGSLLGSIVIILIFVLSSGWLLRIIGIARKTRKQMEQFRNKTEIDSRIIYREMYNLRTHLSKSCIMFCICFCELVASALIISDIMASSLKHFSKHSNCTAHVLVYSLTDSIETVIEISLYINLIIYVSLFSLLTKYLAVRYLVHPSNNVIYKHIAWILLQVFVLVSSIPLFNKFIQIFTIFLLLFLWINWVAIWINSCYLSYALRTNIRDIMNYHWDAYFYRSQVRLYKRYVLFTRVLVAIVFFAVLTLNIISLLIYIEQYIHLAVLFKVIQVAELVFIFLIILPVPFFSFLKFYSKFKSRKKQIYRFNYDNIRPLLRKKDYLN